jgi:hypothetical protein
MGDIATLLTEIFAAEPGYKEAQLYSRGRKNEVWASPTIAAKLGRSANRYRVNIARRPIDAVLQRLKILAVAAVAPSGSGNDDRLTKILNEQIWDANQLDLELDKALDKAETFGDAYLVIWPRVNDAGTIVGVDVMVNSPMGMRVIYDVEDPREIAYAGRTWLDKDKYRRVTIWRDGPSIERYISKDKEDARPVKWEDNQFVPFLADGSDEESWFEDTGLGLGNPVFHLRTADEDGYGVPTHEQVYGCQNMLTKQIATLMDATDGYGFPFRYALSKVGSIGSSTPDDNWGEPGGGGSKPTAPKSERAEPGTIAKLTDTDVVGQLEPAQVANILDPIGMTLRLSSVVSTTPLQYFDPSAASASGESKKEHDKPLADKAEKHRKGYDATLKDAFAYAMSVNKTPVPGVVISWAPTQSVDEKAETEVAQARRDLGVPLKRVLVDLGFDEKDVDTWIEEATPDDEMLEHRVTLLKELAQAAQSFGTAVTLGVMDAATAQTLIAGFLTNKGDNALPPIPPAE